jgi:hypothetical protein
MPIWEERGPCPVFASYTLAFALQLRKMHRKTSVRVCYQSSIRIVPLLQGHPPMCHKGDTE